MSLDLEQNAQAVEKDGKSAALLNKYLKQAVFLTHKDTIFQANRFLSDYATREQWQDIKPEDIEAKDKEISKELKEFGFKDKAAYYANVRAGEHTRETLIKMGVLAATVVVATAVSPELGQAVAGLGTAYVGSKAFAQTVGQPMTPAERFSTSDYVDLKHAQMALRKLARHMEDKEFEKIKKEAVMKGLYPPVSGRGRAFY